MQRKVQPLLSLACLGALFLGAPQLRAADPPAEPPPTAPAKPGVIPGWGRWLDPSKDCKWRLDGGKLAIAVPGTAHDLSVEQGLMNAPMVMQEANGDFTVQVKVSGDFAPGKPLVQGRAAYQGAGFAVAQDNNNYIRLERAVYNRADGQGFHYVNFEVRLNGQVVRLGQSSDYPVPAEVPVYLKLERSGAQMRGSVSGDGQNWKAIGIKAFTAAPKLYVAVSAVNASDAPFAPQFESLKLATAQKDAAN